MTPRVSICLPAYNCARYLAEAIESALEQTFTDFEIIIIDDRSTDGSREIIGGYAARDARIRFLMNEHNVGMVNNWNKCLALARGEYIKFLFSDDLFASPDALRKMVGLMERDRSLSLVASARYVIDEGSRVVKELARYGWKDIVLPGNAVIRDCLLEQRNFIGEPSVVLFRREQGTKGFDTRYRQFVDLEMWLHLLAQGAFGYLHEPLCSFRVHKDQATADNCGRNVHIDEQVMLVRDHSAGPGLRFSMLDRAYMRFIPAMNFWKLFKRHGKLSRDEARQRIAALYQGNLTAFFFFFPVYRIYRLYVSLARRWMIAVRRRLIV